MNEGEKRRMDRGKEGEKRRIDRGRKGKRGEWIG